MGGLNVYHSGDEWTQNKVKLIEQKCLDPTNKFSLKCIHLNVHKKAIKHFQITGSFIREYKNSFVQNKRDRKNRDHCKSNE